MLSQAFVTTHCLDAGQANDGFNSFKQVAKQLVQIAATQCLVEKQELDRVTAETSGTDMLCEFSEWG